MGLQGGFFIRSYMSMEVQKAKGAQPFQNGRKVMIFNKFQGRMFGSIVQMSPPSSLKHSADSKSVQLSEERRCYFGRFDTNRSRQSAFVASFPGH